MDVNLDYKLQTVRYFCIVIKNNRINRPTSLLCKVMRSYVRFTLGLLALLAILSKTLISNRITALQKLIHTHATSILPISLYLACFFFIF